MSAQALIPVFVDERINGRAQLVDGRALHRFLEVDARFNDWIARRLADYDFCEGEDFYSELSKKGKGRPSTEYQLTLDMAKELSMLERNDKGRQARRYFIECEKRLHKVAPSDAATIMAQTIGPNGFHMLGALVKGKVSSLPAPIQRRATAKIWSQTHAAFGVRSAADIPADQLDAARNFIAAYAVLEGEFIPKGQGKSFDIPDKLGECDRYLVSADHHGNRQVTPVPMGAFVLTRQQFMQSMLVDRDMYVSTAEMFEFVALATENLRCRFLSQAARRNAA